MKLLLLYTSFALFTAGYDLRVLELSLSSPPAQPSTVAHVSTTQPVTSKLLIATHITSTSSQIFSIRSTKIQSTPMQIMSTTMTPDPFIIALSFSDSVAMPTFSSSIMGVNSSSLTDMTSPSLMGVATTNLRTISNSPLLSSTVLPTSTLPDHQSNSQAMILIAGVSAGCVVIVLLVAIVIVVCSILSRSPDKRTVTVYSSKKVRAEYTAADAPAGPPPIMRISNNSFCDIWSA